MSNLNSLTVEQLVEHFKKCYPTGVQVPSYYIDKGVLSVYKLHDYYECFENGVITQRNGSKYSGSLTKGSIRANISYANPFSKSTVSSSVLQQTFVVCKDRVYLNYNLEYMKNAFGSGPGRVANNVKMGIKHILQFLVWTDFKSKSVQTRKRKRSVLSKSDDQVLDDQVADDPVLDDQALDDQVADDQLADDQVLEDQVLDAPSPETRLVNFDDLAKHYFREVLTMHRSEQPMRCDHQRMVMFIRKIRHLTLCKIGENGFDRNDQNVIHRIDLLIKEEFSITDVDVAIEINNLNICVEQLRRIEQIVDY